MNAADECGWRQYPPAGEFRVGNVEPKCYAEADAVEGILNYFAQDLTRFIEAEQRFACSYGSNSGLT